MTSFRARATLGAALALCPLAAAQEPLAPDPARQLEDQEQRIRSLELALDELRREREEDGRSDWEVGYDKGYFMRSKTSPFELLINGRMQFRYTGFSPDQETFENLGTAESGEPIEVTRRSDFEIERGRLSFAGTTFDEDLHFYINLDADTDDNHVVIFHDFWFNYEFNRAFDLYAGKAFVPGSREWLMGSTGTHLIDRSLATTFFRPDRSVGVWAIGEPLDDLHYRTMLGNGFQTTDLDFEQINDSLMSSTSVWWEPGGDFGSGYADLKMEDRLRTRLGSSFTFASESGKTDSGSAIAESNFLRLEDDVVPVTPDNWKLEDGTRLTDLGVDHFDVTLLAVDAAMKYRGWSLHGEGYYRWVDDISPTGLSPTGFPEDTNETWGGYLAAGYMLIARTLDLQVRSSTVQGDLKDSWEYAAGVNYYLDGTHGNKLSLDVTHLDGSPVSNSGPNFRVGDDGLLVRLQLQLSF